MNTSNTTIESQVGDIERLVRGSTVHLLPDTLEVPFVLIPEGFKLKDLEEQQVKPRRVREAITLNTVESFIDYLKEWGDANSSIFADEPARSLGAVIDYHEDAKTPSWGTHTAGYTAKLSRELQAWQAAAGKPLPQVMFAEFIEDRIADVASPQGADLLERVLKLQILTKGVFGSALRLQTGEFSLQYSEEQEKGSVELPEKLSLGIPLFHGGVSYKVDVRLRYRLAEGKVTFIYKLVDIDRLIEHAFSEVVQKVAASLSEVKIYQGAK